MADPYVAVQGRRVVRARIALPYYGLWTADLELSSADALPSLVTVVAGNLSMKGAVFRTGAFAGVRYARVVGGFGGWRKVVPSQGYQNERGVTASLLLNDVASLVGERVSLSQDFQVGTIFAREAAPAERLLRQLAGSEWFVDSSGTTQVRDRSTAAISTPFSVEAWDGGRGVFRIATEDVAAWQPGATFSSSTVSPAATVGMTEISVDNDGKLRLTVLQT